MRRVPSIDGFRAISITLVVIHHLLNKEKADVNPLWYLIGNGFLGVFIFFVISGFLITTLLLREADSTGRISLSAFYLRRAFRILPPLYFYIAFAVLAAWALGTPLSVASISEAATLTQNIVIRNSPWQFEHFWSLCIEEQFYLIWPITIGYFIIRHRRQTAIRLVVALIVIAPILRTGVFVCCHDQALRHYLLGLLPAKMDALMYGCGTALAVGTPSFEKVYERASALIWLLLLWVAVISNYLTLRYGNYFSMSIGQTIDGFCIAIMITWAARNAAGAAGRILNCRPVVHIGLISYSVYIWQTWFLHAENHTVFGQTPWNLLSIWLAAEFSYFGIERLSRFARDRLEARLSSASAT